MHFFYIAQKITQKQHDTKNHPLLVIFSFHLSVFGAV
jgi:hypothetical protein